MVGNTTFCSYGDVILWLQNHLLSCPFKKLTGIDCPGCGFQRAVIALLQGNLKESLHYYPAAIPLLLLGLTVLFNKHSSPGKRHIITKALYIFTGLVITCSYLLKLAA